MAVKVLAGALNGIEAIPIEVEVDLLRRLPKVSIVGLAANSVKESSERMRSAIESIVVSFPKKQVIVNLAPADVRKDGTALDLPVALAVMAANGVFDPEALDGILAVGELSLNGDVRPIRGALSYALLARREKKILLLPKANAAQAAMVPGVTALGASHLQDILNHLTGTESLDIAEAEPIIADRQDLDLVDVRGQQSARRALEIAAAGSHHLLFIGPPGCGKTMLARRMPSILPTMNFEQSLETTQIHSAAGLLSRDGPLLSSRPFRAPHHSVTSAGLIGDRHLRPGEVSLAHNGVLFLDEATEFRRSVIEVMRQPLEEGCVQVTRAMGTVIYPAELSLIMASNPCPCGNRGGPRICLCTDSEVRRYRRRLSGPILDRIDLHVELEPVRPSELLHESPGESSEVVRERVEQAIQRQHDRGQKVSNGRLDTESLHQHLHADGPAKELLRTAMYRHQLPGRSTTRVMKVARTIADLADSQTVLSCHLQEALAFRPMEQM